MIRLVSLALAVAALLALGGCTPPGESPPTETPVALPQGAQPSVPALHEVYSDAFLVGAAINQAQLLDEDPRGNPLVEKHFNTITPENVMKWETIHPELDVYDFTLPDALVAYGEAHDLLVVGHALVWHEQTGAWAFEHPDGTPRTREELLALMEDHISTVVGRYKGRVHGWDVVNEALADDGSLRNTPWHRIIGDDFVEQAFRFAHAADPDAELYYNDYGLEQPEKRAGAVRLLQQLVDAGIPVAGVGVQTHMWMDWPSVAEMEAQIEDLAPFGQVMVTELDIGVLSDFPGRGSADISLRADGSPALDPYTEGLPDAIQQKLAERYAETFALFYKHRDVISRVTFWGVTDADSWRNGWPIAGRTNYPLLFDRTGAPKPAFDAVVAIAAEDSADDGASR
ncbi:MAG: endo-1,4-beta-xylanase [Bacteroidota bacterium]